MALLGMFLTNERFTMKIKTSELNGVALDRAVSDCDPDSIAIGVSDFLPYSPSTDWSHGGPIIEREGIQVYRLGRTRDSFWGATMFWDDMHGSSEVTEEGETPLIAAMRCYVAGMLGDEIEVPDCLIEANHE